METGSAITVTRTWHHYNADSFPTQEKKCSTMKCLDNVCAAFPAAILCAYATHMSTPRPRDITRVDRIENAKTMNFVLNQPKTLLKCNILGLYGCAVLPPPTSAPPPPRPRSIHACRIQPHLPWSGYIGVDSNMTEVAPFTKGPYTMYEWPVIQPMSATHANMSPSSRPKACLVVIPV